MRISKGPGGVVTGPPQSPGLERRVASLADLPINALRQVWSTAWGVPPPKSARRRLLTLGIAWKWQAAVYGGQSKPLELRLAKLEASLRQSGIADTGPARRAPAPRLLPGARLIRVWKDERHEVQATETGYRWRGQSWRSLSSIARAITGSRRNGPAFFGLRNGDAA